MVLQRRKKGRTHGGQSNDAFEYLNWNQKASILSCSEGTHIFLNCCYYLSF